MTKITWKSGVNIIDVSMETAEVFGYRHTDCWSLTSFAAIIVPVAKSTRREWLYRLLFWLG